MYMKIEDIIISRQFKAKLPSRNKMISYRNYYREHGRFKATIVVNGRQLINGYTTYLLCKEFGIDEVEVLSTSYRQSPTIYVYGYHPEDGTRKEYVWRLRKDEKTGLNYDCEIEAGDSVPVKTKYGTTNIVVTRVELMDAPPCAGTIKECLLPNGFKRP